MIHTILTLSNTFTFCSACSFFFLNYDYYRYISFILFLSPALFSLTAFVCDCFCFLAYDLFFSISKSPEQQFYCLCACSFVSFLDHIVVLNIHNTLRFSFSTYRLSVYKFMFCVNYEAEIYGMSGRHT